MKKLIFSYCWFLIVLVLIGYIGGIELAICFFIGLIGIIVGLKKGYFREIAAEGFTLYDYEGRLRATLAGTLPPDNHVMAQTWDSSPAIDFYYSDGVKGATLGLDFNEGRETSTVLLYGKNGKKKIGMISSEIYQSLALEHLDSGKSFILGFEDKKDKLCLTNEKGETIWSVK